MRETLLKKKASKFGEKTSALFVKTHSLADVLLTDMEDRFGSKASCFQPQTDPPSDVESGYVLRLADIPSVASTFCSYAVC